MGSSAPLEVGAESQSSVKVMSLVDEDHLQSELLGFLQPRDSYTDYNCQKLRRDTLKFHPSTYIVWVQAEFR